jgi:hypothetical protein
MFAMASGAFSVDKCVTYDYIIIAFLSTPFV